MINGIPLVAHSIIQAKKSRAFDKIVVSTDSKKIQKIARFYEAECWFLRPKYLASGTIAKLPVIKHLLLESEKKFKTKFDIIMDLDVTSPLRLIKDIKNSFKQFLNNNDLILEYNSNDSVVYIQDISPGEYNLKLIVDSWVLKTNLELILLFHLLLHRLD